MDTSLKSVYLPLDTHYANVLSIANLILAQPKSVQEQFQELGFPNVSQVYRVCLLGFSNSLCVQIFQNVKEVASTVYGNQHHFYVQWRVGKDNVLFEFSHNPSTAPTAQSIFICLLETTFGAFITSPEAAFIYATLDARGSRGSEPHVSCLTKNQIDAAQINKIFAPYVVEINHLDTRAPNISVLLFGLLGTQVLSKIDHGLLDIQNQNMTDFRYPDRFLPQPAMTHTNGVLGASGRSYRPYTARGVNYRLVASAQPITLAFVFTIIRAFGVYFKSLEHDEHKYALLPLLKIVHNDFFKTSEVISKKAQISKAWFTQYKLAFGQAQQSQLEIYKDIEAEADLDTDVIYRALRGLLAFCNAASIVHGYTPVYEGLNTIDYQYEINPKASGYRLPTYSEWDILSNGLDHERPNKSDNNSKINSSGFSIASTSVATELTISGHGVSRDRKRDDPASYSPGFMDIAVGPRIVSAKSTHETLTFVFAHKAIYFRLVRYLFVGDK